MRTYIWDGVDALIVYPDVDEGSLYCGGERMYDNYRMYFATWFMSKRNAEYRDWLPER